MIAGMLRKVLIAMALVASSAALAETPHSYGDTLIVGLLAAHKDIAGIAIQATAKDGSAIHLARGTFRPDNSMSVPLTNSMAEPIGTIVIGFTRIRHVPAETVAHEASRRIYLANNLIEPDPFVAGAHRSRRGQAIVDRMMIANSDLVTLGMHIGSSGADNTILASNFGRIGKPGDKDDARVIDQGAVLKEPTNGGRRLAVSLPLLDRRGGVVGALSTSFLVGPGGFDQAAARAVEVRDAIARQIASLAQLVR